jgi:hypothetical protein
VGEEGVGPAETAMAVAVPDKRAALSSGYQSSGCTEGR